MRRVWMLGWTGAVALQSLVASAASAQLKVKLTPTVVTAEKGKTFQINVRLEAEAALDSLDVILLPPENFCVQSVAMLERVRHTVNPDGSASLAALSKGSALTVQFSVSAPTQLKASGSSCGAVGRADSARYRSLDNTRDARTFVFNGRYRFAPGDTGVRLWTESVDIKYTTSQAIFLWGGMLGVVLGYLVKSLTARKPEASQARNTGTTAGGKLWAGLVYLFATSIDKFLTSLVLGFAGLLAAIKSGIPVGGAASAVLIGITIGILADDALISRLK